ncbi:MAG TPA: NADH-quinone oxidoreductase subunit L [Elusimicrobiales bacterium]|nr:NADH-quinone oxidoreductase subunit L [Elusimicrobiales bacterium]HPO95064.1 NADH-quinone oxidoreductase subunit L [Elusimicrobiales bacterium]
MSIDSNLIRWVIISPLITFLINFLFSRFLTKRISAILACLGVGFSFVFSLMLFSKLRSLPQGVGISDLFFNWITFYDLNVAVKFFLDPLSSVMALVVSGVSLLIHIYSIGYMDEDKDFKRFFSYLNLFVFFMLILVLSDNIILMFVGWEGVGLCSYLLIGFWYENINNSKAAKKAFITNRVGDAFFIAGILITYYVLSSNGIFDLSFSNLNSSALLFYNTSLFGFSVLSIITFLFFMGATGKSAQFPLYVWLPDAMAGPTPVSALIHAATMVTAGVYLVARLNPLYQISHTVSNIILYVASFTALFSAVIAVTQRDIKKILAYSTISQLGYMFMGAVSGVYASGVFHLVTHAFFKALLFLSAGAVIHSLAGEQDIFNMGGLKDKIKDVFIVTLVGWLSITGFPFLSGYFSKDFIIENLYLSGRNNVWFLSVLTAFLTAFYMTRLFSIAFLNKPKKELHIHKPSKIMTYPLFALAVLSISAGYFLKPFLFFTGVEIKEHEISFIVKEIPLIASFLGIFLGFVLTRENISDMLENKFKKIHKLVSDKFYVDEIYDFIIITPLSKISEIVFKFIDRKLIDKAMVEGTANSCYNAGKLSSKIDNYNLRNYAAYILSAVVIMLIIFLRSS